jgi:hypothetical protein
VRKIPSAVATDQVKNEFLNIINDSMIRSFGSVMRNLAYSDNEIAATAVYIKMATK